MKKKLVFLFILISTMLMGANFEKPILLTSAGQSADVQMVQALLKKAGLEANFDKSVTADGIKDEKTLILAIGGSSKGLGAAGIKVEDELDRVAKLIEKAKANNIKIIGIHVGGSARRGELSDKFITSTVDKVDYLIVVEDGNKDGLFTNVSTEKNIPLETIPKITSAVDPLKKAFE
ncbi:DUF6305 family protein [Fusobacterium sp. PH5-44]|uniref:DUF6305 family protein n=1 Tax=unclassified Fusobacterium TaxID=2648384 RepID=UPI003D1FA1E8